MNEQQIEQKQFFSRLRLRAAQAGHTLTDLSPARGKPVYIASCWGQTRRFESIRQLELFVDLVTGAIDVRMKREGVQL